MPQKDRHRTRMVDIDFNFNENFSGLPQPGSYSIVMITSGKTRAELNGTTFELSRPAFLCLSEGDRICVARPGQIAAQTFTFSTNFFCMAEAGELGDIPAGLAVFQRSDINTGVIQPDKAVYNRLWEWFFIMGAEVHSQSDSLWVCRIKKYLIQITGMLDELCRAKSKEPVNLALDYIHTNYFKRITLDELCRRAGTNRVTLNKMFKDRFGCTAMTYLGDYRIKMAEKILTYTRMNISQTAQATGFEYDTYFIRRFTRHKGMSPTEYRKITQRCVLGAGEIVL